MKRFLIMDNKGFEFDSFDTVEDAESTP